MKIAYIENVRIPSERAHAYQIVQTCSWMARAGHDVTLVNPDRAQGADVFSFFNLPAKQFHHVLLRSWDPLSSWKIGKRLAYVSQRWSFTRALRKWASSRSFDAWYTRDPAMIDALRGVVSGPWFLELHDDPAADSARWQRILPSVTGFIAISEGVRDRLQELGIPAELIHLAPDGYDPKEFNYLMPRNEARNFLNLAHLSDEDIVAMYTGSFYPWKGVELAIEAWRLTPSHWHLLLIGGPPQDCERIRKFISLMDKAVQKRIHLRSWISRRSLFPSYRAADVALLLSSPKYDLASRFTSPLKQFEYLAAGLPILASDVSSSHEILDENVARFFKPTRDGFLSALEDIGKDSEWRDRAAKIAPKFVQPFAWEKRANLIVTWIADRICT